MSNVKKFEELLRSDESLQEKVRAAIDAYEGDMQDGSAIFAAVVAPLAAEAGLPFTVDEAREFAQGDREISLDEVDAAAGGDGMCIGFGFGGLDTMDADACESIEVDFGAGACVAVGVGIMGWA